jgi:hypothetical protein
MRSFWIVKLQLFFIFCLFIFFFAQLKIYYCRRERKKKGKILSERAIRLCNSFGYQKAFNNRVKMRNVMIKISNNFVVELNSIGRRNSMKTSNWDHYKVFISLAIFFDVYSASRKSQVDENCCFIWKKLNQMETYCKQHSGQFLLILMHRH